MQLLHHIRRIRSYDENKERSQRLVPMVILTSLVQRGALLVGFSAIVLWATTIRLKYPRSADRLLGDAGFVPTERRMRVPPSLNSEMAVRQA